MTVQTNLAIKTYTGNGVTLDFPVPFRFLANSHIKVTLTASGGTAVDQVETTNYVLTGARNPSGGNVAMIVAPPTGYTLAIFRNMPFTQLVDYRANDPFPEESAEDIADERTMEGQQILETLGRAITLPPELSGFSGQLPSPDPLAPLVWNAAGTGVENGSTTLTGDMLLRPNLALPGDGSGADLVAFRQTGVDSVSRTVQDKLRERISLLDSIPISLHAGILARTATANMVPYITAALAKASSEGRDVYAPPGIYPCTSGFVLNEGSDTDDYSPRAALIGDGGSNTIFDFAAGNFIGVTLQGGSSGGTHLNLRSGGFGLRKADRLGIGMLMDNCAYSAIRDVQATGWETGIKATDCLTSEFNRITLRNNDIGFAGEFSSSSFPNALSFISCELGINRLGAMRIIGGGSITFYGGAVEGNGWVGGGIGYGLYIEDAGAESAVGLAVHGTYFEANEGLADVWIKNTIARSAAHDFTGATFNRVGNVSFVTNNVRIENLSTGDIKVSLSGCGFKGFGAYTPNAGRQYITAINSGGGTVRVNRVAGNYYQSATENVELSGISDSESSIPIMWGRFSIGAGVVNKVATKNVGVATYNGAGDYTINLEQGVTGASYAVFPGQNHSAFCSVQAFKASDTAITVNVWNAAGVKFDPAGFSLQVYALRQ